MLEDVYDIVDILKSKKENLNKIISHKCLLNELEKAIQMEIRIYH